MIEVRRVRPEEYVDAGDVTASAWGPGGSPDDESWLSFRARVADVAGRDAVAAVFIATENDCILGRTRERKDATDLEHLGEELDGAGIL